MGDVEVVDIVLGEIVVFSTAFSLEIEIKNISDRISSYTYVPMPVDNVVLHSVLLFNRFRRCCHYTSSGH